MAINAGFIGVLLVRSTRLFFMKSKDFRMLLLDVPAKTVLISAFNTRLAPRLLERLLAHAQVYT